MATVTGRSQSWLSVPLEVTAFWPHSPGFNWHVTNPFGIETELNTSPTSGSWRLEGVSTSGNPNPGFGSLSIPTIPPPGYGLWHVKIWVATIIDGQGGVNILEGDFMVGEPPVIGPKPPGCKPPGSL